MDDKIIYDAKHIYDEDGSYTSNIIRNKGSKDEVNIISKYNKYGEKVETIEDGKISVSSVIGDNGRVTKNVYHKNDDMIHSREYNEEGQIFKTENMPKNGTNINNEYDDKGLKIRNYGTINHEEFENIYTYDERDRLSSIKGNINRDIAYDDFLKTTKVTDLNTDKEVVTIHDQFNREIAVVSGTDIKVLETYSRKNTDDGYIEISAHHNGWKNVDKYDINKCITERQHMHTDWTSKTTITRDEKGRPINEIRVRTNNSQDKALDNIENL